MASVFTGFSLSAVYQKAREITPHGAGAITWTQVPAVIDAKFQLDVSSVEQWGDNKLIDMFYHSQKGKINVKGTKISTAALEVVTGQTASTYSSVDCLDIGTEDELVPPHVTVKALIPARDSADGSAKKLTCLWYNTSVKTAWQNMPGATRAELVEVQLEYDTFASLYDHRGDPLAKEMHGRLFFGELALG